MLSNILTSRISLAILDHYGAIHSLHRGLNLWKRCFKKRKYRTLCKGSLRTSSTTMSLDEKKDTKAEGGYVIETTSDVDLPSYEDAAVTTGAPTEKVSPLGYHVDWISVIFLVCPPSFRCRHSN